MATYDELLTARESETLRKKVRVATMVAAQAIMSELPTVTNHTERMKWAKQVLSNPDGEADKLLWPVIVANKSSSLATIVGASDAGVQSAVDAAVNVLAPLTI